MAKIEQLTGVIVDTGKKFYRDKTLNAGSVLFDVSNGWAGGAKNITAGTTIKSLDYGNTLMTSNRAHTYGNGGMIMVGVAGDQFQLPAAVVPAQADKHYMWVWWAKFSSTGQNGFNNQMLQIGEAYNVPGNMVLNVTPVSDGSDKTSIIRVDMSVLGKAISMTSLNALMNDHTTHQYAVEVTVSSDGLTFVAKVWCDKVVVFTSNSLAMPASWFTAAQRWVGTSGSYALAWSGSFYRFRYDNLVLGQKATTQVLTEDFAFCSPRFS